MKVKISHLLITLMLISCLFPRRFVLFGIYSFVIEVLVVAVLVFAIYRVKSITWTWKNFLLLAMLLLHTMSYVIHNNLKAMMYGVLAPVLIIFLLYRLISDEEKFEYTLKATAYIFLIVAALSILETLTSFNLWDKLSGYTVIYTAANGYRFGMARARGAFETSINNGMFMLLGQGVILYCITKYPKAILYKISYAVIVVATILIMSRATIIGTVLLILLWMFKAGMRKLPTRILKISILLLVLYGAVRLFNITAVLNFFEWTGNALTALIDSSYVDYESNVGDSGQRLILFAWIYEATLGHRIWGLGEYAVFSQAVNSIFTKTSIENYFLWVFFRFGLVGVTTIVLPLCGFITSLVKNDRKGLKNADNTTSKLTFPGMMLCTSLVYIATNLTCAGQNDTLFFCAIIGVTMAYNSISDRRVYQ